MDRVNKLLLLTILLLLMLTGCWSQQGTEIPLKKYAIADLPTPVFNTPEFSAIFGGSDGKTLRSGKCGQLWELEFVALPKTAFRVESKMQKGKTTIYKVTTDDYPSKKELFIDSRFVKTTQEKPPQIPRQLPPQQAIIERLISAEKSAYVWGGNIRDGILETLSFYPPSSGINPELKDRWTLKGLDCSGLLYEAANGYTPRNTDALLDFGSAVQIAGLNVSQIINKIKPLDLIIWKGHVIIILDKDRAIESRLDYDKKTPGCQGGVRIRPLKEFLGETLKNKMPIDEYNKVKGGKNKFVIRRWYGINK